MLQRLIGEHIDVRLTLADDLGAVHADPGQLDQIIMNLAFNARDAMPDGGRLTIETANIELDVSFASKHGPVEPDGLFRKLREVLESHQMAVD